MTSVRTHGTLVVRLGGVARYTSTFFKKSNHLFNEKVLWQIFQIFLAKLANISHVSETTAANGSYLEFLKSWYCHFFCNFFFPIGCLAHSDERQNTKQSSSVMYIFITISPRMSLFFLRVKSSNFVFFHIQNGVVIS
jgi:hypothetical protein